MPTLLNRSLVIACLVREPWRKKHRDIQTVYCIINLIQFYLSYSIKVPAAFMVCVWTV